MLCISVIATFTTTVYNEWLRAWQNALIVIIIKMWIRKDVSFVLNDSGQ